MKCDLCGMDSQVLIDWLDYEGKLFGLDPECYWFLMELTQPSVEERVEYQN